jgi:crotonobetainyl-CoA:carnitine CoA-transferase CaiB-like acyl-CoA transferase
MQPLAGIKVLEFSTMITASFAAMMMAEQGAEVIKVEPVELGDPMRYLGSSKGGISGLFANCNRGKRSLRIDIKSNAGRDVVHRLAADTDVLLCNFRPGVMDALGLGAAALRQVNPRLIYAAINGFGNAGPDSDKPAYDPVIQAQAGFAAVQGEGSDTPQFVRNLVCDKITAYTACQAVTAALFQRERTGQGQLIELSMMDAGLYFLFPDGFMHRTLLDDDVEHAPPLSQLLYEMTHTRDGAITVSAANQAQQVGLLTAIDQLHLFADERFNSMEKIVANILEFRAVLRDEMSKFTTDDLLQRLADNDVPAAKCLTYEDVLGHPQYEANESIDLTDHPRMGTLRRVKPPARFGGRRLEPAGHTAAHGEHTHDILTELGFSDADIAALVAEKIAAGITPT